MTAFHDTIMAMEPDIFIPHDNPLDDGGINGQSYDLAADAPTSHYLSRNGAVQAPAVGSVAFTKELQFDGINDFASANSALWNTIVNTVGGGAAATPTVCVWWRTTNNDASDRYLLRLGSTNGFHLRKSAANIYAHFYGYLDGVQYSIGFPSTTDSERGGGWQMSTFQLDPLEGNLVLGRNGFRSNYTPTIETIRTTSATNFIFGANTTGSNFWSGSLGPLMMWSRSLTGGELLDVFQAGLGATRVAEADYPIIRRPVEARCRPGVVGMRAS